MKIFFNHMIYTKDNPITRGLFERRGEYFHYIPPPTDHRYVVYNGVQVTYNDVAVTYAEGMS